MKFKLTISVLLSMFTVMNLFGNSLPQNIQEYLDKANITEYGIPSNYEDQETQNFINYVKTNSTSLLENLEEIAPDLRRQALLLVGFQHLEGTDYLAFLQQVNILFQNDSLPLEFFSEVYHEDFIFKKGFLAYNYQHPMVAPILETAESIAPSNHKAKTHLQRLRSGKAYAAIKAYIEYENLTAPDILP